MKIQMYQVDAFTSQVFCGNPAAVCLLDNWLPDELLQGVAAENNLSGTAFLVRDEGRLGLRWFTPVTEVVLCGHATLASAFVLFDFFHWPEPSIRFSTRKSGQLVVRKTDSLLEMDCPARPPVPVEIPNGLGQALGNWPREVLGSEEDILVVYQSEQAVRDTTPDFSALSRMSRCNRDCAWATLRLCVAVLRTKARHSGGSRNRIGALCIGALLGQGFEEEAPTCTTGFEERWRTAKIVAIALASLVKRYSILKVRYRYEMSNNILLKGPSPARCQFSFSLTP